MKRKFTYDEVFEDFKTHNCILLSTVYEGSKSKLNYQCSCGNVATIEYRCFRQGKRCNKCSRLRANETNKINHNGSFAQSTKQFLDQRMETWTKNYGVSSPMKSSEIKANREKTNLKKYGVPHVAQTDEHKLKIKNSFLEKYGVEYSMQIPAAKEKFKETLLSKYGVPSLAYLGGSYSKESQKLFWELYHMIPTNLQSSCYFAELNKEFVIQYEKQFYKYDFVNSQIKLVIEYDGSKFHPPSNLQNETKNWCVFHPELTIAEALTKQQLKEKGIKERGFSIIRIKDTKAKNPDYRKSWLNQISLLFMQDNQHK